MIKSFLIIISLQLLLYGSSQILLVVSDGIASSDGKLEAYEDGKKVFSNIDVKLGKNGLAWDQNYLNSKKKNFSHVKTKKEGDKKAPAGIFSIDALFAYEYNENKKMPFIHATKEMICVDDSNSPYYNQIIKKPTVLPKSFEEMKMDTHEYQFGIVVGYNKEQKPLQGSCIFLHLYKTPSSATSGCTAMSLEDIKKIYMWLDKKKNPLLIQIPKSEAEEILKRYPELKNSELLNSN